MKCKFCNEEIDILGAFDKSRCSWCQREQPFFNNTCWICESPIKFVDGVAVCEDCGVDYITESAKKEINELYADYLDGVSERMAYDCSRKN